MSRVSARHIQAHIQLGCDSAFLWMAVQLSAAPAFRFASWLLALIQRGLTDLVETPRIRLFRAFAVGQ
jgi:hypothetical protein